MAVDGRGVVWGLGVLSGFELSIYRYDGGAWLPSYELGASRVPFWGLAADPRGGVWAVNGEQWQVVHVDSDGVQVYAYPYERGPGPGWASMAVDGQGRPWVGDDVGLFRLEQATDVGVGTWGEVKAEGRIRR
jgi:hypothetical protein